MGVTPAARRGKRNGALDGLRGLAVIAVMAYHVVPDPFTGGWLGVDVFFVLSGFLICSMLLREHQRSQRIDYVRFLLRRARRLMPGMVMMLLATLVAAMVFEGGERRRSVAVDVLSSALQVSNWRLILSGESYFAKVAAPSPIRHTWSLGVQEQFYLVFPLVLILIFTTMRRYRSMALVLGALALLSLGLMTWLYDPGTDPSRVYFGTGTRLFELLVGVVGAVLLHWRTQRAERRPVVGRPRGWTRTTEAALGWAGIGCLLLLAVWMFTVDEFSPWLFLGGLAGIDLMTLVVITAATSPFPNVLARLLANRPLMKAGDMSYSLYLWHWPVIVYLAPAMQGAPELTRQVAAVVVTIAISTVSFTYVENPIHRHGLRGLSRLRPRLGPGLALAAGPMLLAGAVTLTMTPGFVRGDDVQVGLPADPHYGTSQAQLPPDVPRHHVVLVGASTAAGLAAKGKSERTPDVTLTPAANVGCRPFARETVEDGSVTQEAAVCDEFRKQWPVAVEKADHPTVVFFLTTSLLSDFRVDGKVVSPPSPEYDRAVTEILDQWQSTTRQRGAARMAVMNLACHERSEAGGGDVIERTNDIGTVKHFNAVVDDWSEESGAEVYDMYGLLCPGDRYHGTINGKPLYEDTLHFSSSSAPLVWRWLAAEVREDARS